MAVRIASVILVAWAMGLGSYFVLKRSTKIIPFQATAVSVGSKDVYVRWRAFPGVKSYMLFRTDDSGRKSLIANTSGTDYVDAAIDSQAWYQYEVVPMGLKRAARTPKQRRFSCLSKKTVHRIKQIKSESELRAMLDRFLVACDQELATVREPQLSIEEKKLILAAMVSHLSAPYGAGSTASSLFDLLDEQVLDCGKYAVLMLRLFGVHTNGKQSGKTAMVGFDGGYIGNHAQVIYESELPILADPTAGIIAFAPYDEIIAGKPVSEDKLFEFYSYWEDHSQFKTMDRFTWMARAALLSGLYKPGDVIYYDKGGQFF